MGNLTRNLPKPMLKIGGKPILEHIIEGLVRAAVKGICVITGWQSEVIETHFGNGEAWGTSIRYAHQKLQNGTGRATELAKDFVGKDSFLLTYGDIFVKRETYCTMVRRFEEGDFAGLLAATEGKDLTKGGMGVFDERFCLVRLVEKPTPAQLHTLQKKGRVFYNAGIYVFAPLVFDFIAQIQKSSRGEYELTDAIQAMIEAEHSLGGHLIVGGWADVRDEKVLADLNSFQNSFEENANR